MRSPGTRGTTLLDLLVGTALGLTALGALTASIAGGGRLLIQGGARGELEDVTHIAVEALAFDVRRAGWDPRGAGITRLVEAAPDRLTVTADLDGDGAIDVTSEESVQYVCTPPPRRLSRIVGRQSLPLTDGVTACAFQYVDTGGATMVVGAGGLTPAERARVRAVALDLEVALAPLHVASRRRTVVALRGGA
jgi:Tfp pilus assembly protein PilW